jgi:hypothetical protein
MCLTFSFTLHFTLQLVLLHNKQIHRNILILIKPLEQILLLQPLSQQLRDIEVISIPTSNVPLFLSFPLNPFPPNYIPFIGIVFEPLNLGAPTEVSTSILQTNKKMFSTALKVTLQRSSNTNQKWFSSIQSKQQDSYTR